MKKHAARPIAIFSSSIRALLLRGALGVLVVLLPAAAVPGANVSQTTFQTTVDKLSDSQTSLELKLNQLQTKFENYIRTNMVLAFRDSLTPAQISSLAQSAADTYVRGLDLSAKTELVKDSAVRDSVSSVSNELRGFETNLLNAIKLVMATNSARIVLAPPGTNVVETNSGQVINGLQVISKQIAALHTTVNALQARTNALSDRSFYAILVSGVSLLIAGAASCFLVCSRSAAHAQLANANLDRNVRWFGTTVQCVGRAVSENLETLRTDTSQQLSQVKAHCEATLNRYDGSLRDLHERTTQRLGDLNSKLSNAGDEISTALRLYAGELTGNRLQAELDAATVLWKRSFDQTLVQEQARGTGCLQQLRSEADGELRKALHLQNQQAQMVARECVEHLRSEFQETLRGEIKSARDLWARHIEEERQGLTKHLGGFVERQAETLRQSVESTTQVTQKILDNQLQRLKGQAEQTLQGIQRVLATSREQLQAIHSSLGAEFDRLKERDEAFSDLFWPGCFKHGPLAGWRERIQAGAIRREPAAVELMLALGRFNNADTKSGDLRKRAEALHAVSLDAYQFWKAIGAKVLDASQEWQAVFQSALDASKTPLDIMLVLEGERFDMNTMLVAGGGSEGRIVVREVLSWIVRDKSGPVAKVLCHGWVNAG